MAHAQQAKARMMSVSVKNEEIKDKTTRPFFIKTRDISPDCTVLFGPILLSSVPFTPSP